LIQKDGASKSSKQDDAHKSVGRKESRVQATEIVSAHEPVLVNKKGGCCNHSYKSDWSELRSYE
jgi:hypothetical protein